MVSALAVLARLGILDLQGGLLKTGLEFSDDTTVNPNSFLLADYNSLSISTFH